MTVTFDERSFALDSQPVAIELSTEWHPLSSGQKGLWLLYKLQPELRGDFNIALTLRARPALDAARLHWALTRLAERHPMLRARFIELAAEPRQTLHPQAGVPLRTFQVDSLDDGAVAAAVMSDRRRPFDLQREPPVRASLYSVRERESALCVVFDHIASDGWSMYQFTRELGALLTGDEPAERAPSTLGAEYFDYVAHERAWLKSPRAEKQLAYWRDVLSSSGSVLELRPDVRSAATTEARTSLEVVLKGELYTALHEFSARQGTTLFVTLLSAYAALLHRLTGQSQLAIGSAMPTRGDSWKRTFGNFVNLVVMPSSLNSDTTVAELMRNLGATALRTLKHKAYPFDELLQRLTPDRTQGRNPWFQALYTHQNARDAQDLAPIFAQCSVERALPWGGGLIEPFGDHLPSGGTGEVLSLQTLDLGDRICTAWGFDSHAFERDTILRFAQCWTALLEAMVRAPDAPVSRLPWLSDAERRQLLFDWNAAAAATEAAPALMHTRFEAHVRRAPDALAVQFEDRRLSYRELNTRANRLARHLRELGVGPDVRVGVCCERGLELVVALLATLKAGGAYMPLDPEYPSERLAHMLHDGAPRVVLTTATTHGKLAALGDGAQLIDVDVDDAGARWAHALSTNLSDSELGLTDEHLAYVIYTSGSTGLPKGALNEHRGLANLIEAQTALFQVDAASRVLAFASPSFDASVFEIGMALGHGASLHLARRDDLMPGRPLLDTLARYGITHVTLPPSALSLCDLPDVPFAARTVIVAGEAIGASEASKWAERVTLFNAYGPSETSVCATAQRCAPAAKSVAIGRPIRDARIYILDAHAEPVPVSVPGEIYIGGTPVGRGYLNRPELTQARFVADPFSGYGRMYRTGDLGRFLPDGRIEYLGRNDSQVKLRGYRIELGEIEARLSALAGVSDVIAMLREDRPGDARLVVYYRGSGEPEALRAHACASLPEYMVPAAYVRLEALPVTSNGKLDRSALPVPSDGAYVSEAYAAPQGDVEQAIAGIWSALLERERIGRHDNFFQLGGSSLIAVRMLERMRQLGLYAGARALFAHPTLAGFAANVAREHDELQIPPPAIPAGARRITPDMLPLVALPQAALDRIAAHVPGGAANIQDIYPLTPLQEGILFHHRTQTSGDDYLLPTLMRFDSHAALCAFVQTLQAVMDRHDVLRSCMAWDGLDEPVQIVLRRVSLPLETLRCDAGDVWPMLQARFDPERYRIDVREAPLLRAFAARDDRGVHEGTWLLVLVLHHLLGDHTALQLVVSEAQAIGRGRAAQLPATVPFRNFVAQTRLGSARSAQERFFRERLADIDEPTAPFGRLARREAGSSAASRSAFETLTPEVALGIRECARKLGVSAASVLHLAWALVLARASGRSDVVFGTVLLGRMHSEASQRALGMFINTLPLRVQLDGRSVAQSLRELQSQLAALLEHEHAPLALAQRMSGLPAGTPLLSALLNYRHAADRAARAEAAEQPELMLPWGEGRTHYPLSLSVDDLGSGFALTLQAAAGIDPERVCDQLERALVRLLSAAADAPETPVRDIDVLPPEELEQLAAWNATYAQFPQDRCLHELVEQQVERTPDAIAVVLDDDALTYRELNARANRLAHYLLQHGVRPDVRVAICMDRSLSLVVALLATLKAGAAYVPLDPDYPRERLEQMLHDCLPIALLTHTAALARTGELTPCVLTLDLDRDAARWSRCSSQNPDPAELGLTSEHLAYVIYTSGSTGAPKGAMNEHRALVNRLVWMQREYGIDSAEVVLQKTPYSFDVSVWEFFCTLISGARLVLARPGGHRDPDYVSACIRRQGVTLVHFVPSMLQAFLAQPGARQCTGLSQVICSGEALPAALVRRFHAQLPGVLLHNLYGPTEAAIDVTAYTCAPDDVKDSTPIGRPVANTQIYVLDEHHQLLPVGATGELYIGGVQVGRGYLQRPELTAERFVDNPFDGGRMYKTGDLGRWSPDGYLEYLGRRDFQVKLRGFRIELGEIEAQLAQVAGVAAVVALVREDEPGDQRLVVYFAGDYDAVQRLRARARAALPEYMRPAAYVHVAELPLSANGKLDRRALPAPQAGAYAHSTYAAPSGAVETLLARIWADVLRRPRVGRDDNFFELGGHSLSAMTLLERMRAHGLHADVRSVFESRSLAELASMVSEPRRERGVPASAIPAGARRITPEMLPLIHLSQSEIDAVAQRIPGGAANVQDVYPLTALQHGLLFHHLLAGSGDTYLTPALLGFASRSQLEACVRALQRAIDRHDILRTAVVWQGEHPPLQVVQRTAALRVTWVDCDPTRSAADELRERYHPRHYRLELHEAPLLRAFATEDARSGRWLLLVLLHHMIDDQTTLKLLVREIELIMAGREAELPPSVPFRNFVAQSAPGSDAPEHAAFFRELLGDVNEPTAPFGLRDVQGDGSEIREARTSLAPELSQAIRERAQRHGVSAASLVHLAWALVLARCSDRSDVVFGTVLFGRTQASAEALGMFINTLPARANLRGQSARQSLRAMHTLLASLLRHEHAPLALAQRCSALPAQTPLFTALLNYRHATEAQTQPAVRPFELLWVEERTNYPFAMSVDDGPGGFTLTAQIAGEVAPERVCALLETALERLVHALDADAERPVLALDVLPDAERQRVLRDSKAPLRAQAHDKLVHELFEARAERTPDAVALVHGATHIRYRELNALANRLARRLRALSVVPDARVAICTERTPDFVVAVLATLKAGGAYVPLDPSYPAQRLHYMLQDSAPAAVLVDDRGRIALSDAGVRAAQLIDVSDRHAALHSSSPTDNLNAAEIGLTPRHLAYVIYTSGSTGQPKGVTVEHRGFTNLVQAQLAHFGVTPHSRVLQFASTSFDASASELGMALCQGASLYLAPPAELLPGRALLDTLARHHITHVTLPPSALSVCDDADQPFAASTLIAAGEAISLTEANKWAARLALFNAYGPTEATVCATAQRCAPQAERVSIGTPIDNARVYILDAALRPVPVGALGELYIGGAGVARGYLKRPGLTAERFVPDAFSAEPGARMYRTGDLGRWLDDGSIEYVGRNDSQVKLRGFRIELGEIEARLSALPGVSEVVVLARAAASDDRRLVAYYRGEPASDALHAHAASALPRHMLPAAYVRVASWPLTANGKIDRGALPEPGAEAYSGNDPRGYEAPEGELEQALADIWGELLGHARVGRWDDYFALGGHSISAVQLITRVQRELRIAVPLRELYAHPRLADFARAVAEARHVPAPSSNLVQLSAAGARPPLFGVHPLSGTVEYLRRLTPRLHPQLPVYGLEASGWQADTAAPESVPALAARYLAAVRSVQPEGPYRLLGYSAGGVIAYAMAEQLVAEGERVAFLGLIDARADINSAERERRVLADIAALERQPDAERAQALADARFLRHLAEALVPAERRREFEQAADGGELEVMLGLLRSSPHELTALGLPDAWSAGRALRVMRGLQRALCEYRPRPLPIAATLFIAKSGMHEHDLSKGWRALLSDRLRCVPLEGTHESMLAPPHIDALARAIGVAMPIPDAAERAPLRRSHARRAAVSSRRPSRQAGKR